MNRVEDYGRIFHVMKPRRSIHVGLPDDTYQRIKHIARDQQKPQSYVARELIEKSLLELRALEDAGALARGSQR